MRGSDHTRASSASADKWERGTRREDFNLAARHQDRPRKVDRAKPANGTRQDEHKWDRGQRRPAFNRAARHEQRRPQTRRAPATREELGRRTAARAAPRAAANYTPGNRTEQYVHERTANYNEARIRHIRERLALRKHQARDDFGRGR